MFDPSIVRYGLAHLLGSAVRRPLEFFCFVVFFFLFCAGAGLVGCIIRARALAPFKEALPSYFELVPGLPPDGVDQPTAKPGKWAKGKMVVVNVEKRGIDDLHFDLPGDLSASKPDEVGTVVLLRWEERQMLKGPNALLARPEPGMYCMVGKVKVFDWESKSEIASATIYGDPPPGYKIPGPKPKTQVLKYLTDLPHARPAP